jgi:hypothetical protein
MSQPGGYDPAVDYGGWNPMDESTWNPKRVQWMIHLSCVPLACKLHVEDIQKRINGLACSVGAIDAGSVDVVGSTPIQSTERES